jgi:hypothetical protein
MARAASTARCAPWRVSAGNPPSDCANVSTVVCPSASGEHPLSNSVSLEAQAMEVVHPRQRKRACVTLPCSTFTASRKTSPQTGLLTSTDAVAPSNSPTLRGFWKWSSTSLENMVIEYDQVAANWATALLRRALRKILLFHRSDHHVVGIDHLGQVKLANLGTEFVGVEFG